MMKYLFTILLLSLMCCGFAQTDSASLRFHFLGVKDGLPEGSVNTLLQDKYGYIWIGTQNGLVRYDGYTPKVYNLKIRGNAGVNVKYIFEDRKGRLWVSAFGNSLFYYDRSRDAFTSYVPDVPKQNAGDDYIVAGMTDDNRGSIWFVLVNLTKVYNEVVSFNPDTHVFTSYGGHQKGNRYLPANHISSLAITGSGIVLAGGENGLYRYNAAPDSFTRCITSPDSLTQRRIALFVADKENKDAIWMASGNAKSEEKVYDNLILYNAVTGALQSYHHTKNDTGSFPGTAVHSVYCAAGNTVWIGCDAGLIRFDKTAGRFFNYLPRNVNKGDIYNTEVDDIQGDNKGNLWCATYNGLLFFNTKTEQFERYTYDPKSNNNIADNNIRSFMVDKTGIVWFGAAQLGLQWANTGSSKFTQYQDNASLRHYFPGGAVYDVAESKNGMVWLSTDKGLYNWQPGTDVFTHIQLGKRADENYYNTSVIVDDEGMVWSRALATNFNIMGLYGYNPETKKVVNYRYKEGDSTSLSNNTIRTLYQDHTGAIWAGTFGGGVCRLDKKTGRFTRYPYVNNIGALVSTEAIEKKVLDDDEVQTIYEDETGTLWAGTNNGSLNRLDRNADRFVPYQKPIANMQCVLSILSDGKGKLWSGTYTSGVYLIDTKQNTYADFSEANGLLYNGSWGMQYDNSGNVWMSSPRGLSIVSGNSKIQNLTVAGGLPAEPLNFFIFKLHNGHFIYGTSDGFVLFNPEDVITKPLTPPIIHIESVAFAGEKNGQLQDSVLFAFGRKEIQLAYDENRLTIRYVGLQYQNVSLTRYLYQLQGYDKGWIDGGTQRQITYTNLSPGSYTFHVKAINSDGVESKTIDSINIVISPPWWQTWWAYLLYFLLLAAAVWSFILYRSKQLVAQNKLLEKRVDERTQQLNQSITELKTTQAQLVQSEKMASLGELTAGIAHEIQNPLNFVNNFSEVNKEMLEELKAERAKPEADRDEALEEELITELTGNEEKIAYHGKRADAIVKNMLQHSRKSSGQKELTDINALCDEYLRLSYHGMRTKDKNFNAQLQTDFDNSMGNISIVPQDFGRVLLNLFNNAFYAVRSPQPLKGSEYKPLVSVSTKKINTAGSDKATSSPSGVGGLIEIVIKDNGSGIPQNILTKIFQPFFTTKPTGEGTGLGLSLSYDIITKEHGGTLEVESAEGEGTTFIIRLPAVAAK